MKEARNTIAARERDLAAGAFLWTLAGLSFFVYPLAVFPGALRIGQSVLFNLPFSISLPGAIVLGLLAVPVMLHFSWRLHRGFVWAVAVFAVMLLVHIPKEMAHLDEFLLLFGYVAIALAAAVLRAHGRIDLNKIAAWAVVLWILQIVLGSVSFYRGLEPVGTPGNINWMAGLLLMLSPWVVRRFMQAARRNTAHPRTAAVLALTAWLIPTVFILYHCHSRSAWLALGLLPAALVVMRMRRMRHKLVVLGLLAAVGLASLAAAYIHFPVRLLQVVEKDVRIPLWTGTAVMIAKHPLGVGAGAYQKAFTPLRRVSSYQKRLWAADMTVHPHNEILNVGARLGIPAMAAFAVMLATVFRSGDRDTLPLCVRSSAYFAVALSMFDMHLVQPPTNFLGFFFLGLCWPLSVPPGPTAERRRPWAWPKRLLSGLAICAVLVIGWIDVTHDIDMRQGDLAEAVAYAHLDAGAPEAGQKYLEAAVAHYKAALTPFSRIIAYYQIGRLSLMLPRQTDQARVYLDRVAAMDPNFSHLNLLYGQLHLQKKDWAGAERYFRRECQFYPRSERAWQNMYTFAAGSGLYNRLSAIDTLLAEIYRERARQNYTDAGLAARQKRFAAHAPHKNPADALADAEALLDRIHHNFVDPIFVDIIGGQHRPAPFLAAGFNVLDAGTWRLRHTLFAALQGDLGPLPVPAADLVSWYVKKITIKPGEPLTFPLGVWNRRAGSALSAYLLFSMVCELNHYPAIICTDEAGRPVCAYVFAKRPVRDGMLPIGADQTAANLQRVDIFQVDLAERSCKPVAAADFKANFQWQGGRTLVFYPLPDYFLRNQILGVIVKDTVPWLPLQPPSKRLLDLFALTDSRPPPPALLRHFCFDGHIRRHLERIQALQPRPADK